VTRLPPSGRTRARDMPFRPLLELMYAQGASKSTQAISMPQADMPYTAQGAKWQFVSRTLRAN